MAGRVFLFRAFCTRFFFVAGVAFGCGGSFALRFPRRVEEALIAGGVDCDTLSSMDGSPMVVESTNLIRLCLSVGKRAVLFSRALILSFAYVSHSAGGAFVSAMLQSAGPGACKLVSGCSWGPLVLVIIDLLVVDEVIALDAAGWSWPCP